MSADAATPPRGGEAQAQGRACPHPHATPPTPLFRNLIFGVIAQEDAQHLSHPQGLNDVIDNDLLFELHQTRTTHDRSEYKI